MSYSQRVTYTGALYHVVARGNNKQSVFQDDQDYGHFLRILLYAKRKQPFQLFGYCLMTNHVHLLMRPQEGSLLSKIMHVVLRTYAAHYNDRYQCTDHLWRSRFKSRLVVDDLHAFRTVIYIDLNPVHAGMCATAEQYPWSSARAHVLGVRDPCLDDYPPLATVSNYQNVLELSTGGS